MKYFNLKLNKPAKSARRRKVVNQHIFNKSADLQFRNTTIKTTQQNINQ